MPQSLRDSIILNGTYIGNNCVRFVKHAKHLGIIIDESLSFEDQINRVVKSCFGVIRKLAEIKSFLSYEQLRTIICACVFSEIDYCNALYYGVNANLLNKAWFPPGDNSQRLKLSRYFRRQIGKLGTISTLVGT